MSNFPTRVVIPPETEWTEIHYHPGDIITRMGYRGDKIWEDMIPGCKIEVVPEDLGFMRHLVHDIKVKIIYPPEWQEMYVEPLARIHKEFFEALSAVIYDVYPINPHNMKRFRLGGEVHSLVAASYYDSLDYKEFTPQTWSAKLNQILEFIETTRIKNEFELTVYSKALEGVINGDVP